MSQKSYWKLSAEKFLARTCFVWILRSFIFNSLSVSEDEEEKQPKKGKLNLHHHRCLRFSCAGMMLGWVAGGEGMGWGERAPEKTSIGNVGWRQKKRTKSTKGCIITRNSKVSRFLFSAVRFACATENEMWNKLFIIWLAMKRRWSALEAASSGCEIGDVQHWNKAEETFAELSRSTSKDVKALSKAAWKQSQNEMN